MGGILSKPKIPGPSPEQIKLKKKLVQHKQNRKHYKLAEQAETEEAKKLKEMKLLQERKKTSQIWW